MEVKPHDDFCTLLCFRMFELDQEKLEKGTSRKVMIHCGPLPCVFEVKLYRFKGYAINHELYVHPQSSVEDDVFPEVDNAYIN